MANPGAEKGNGQRVRVVSSSRETLKTGVTTTLEAVASAWRRGIIG